MTAASCKGICLFLRPYQLERIRALFLVLEDMNMADFQHTFEKWRKMLLRTNYVMAVLVLAAEAVMYFVLKDEDLILQSTRVYMLFFLVIPTLSDALIIVTGLLVLKILPPDSKMINYVPSVQLALICAVTAGTHYVFAETLCIFCFPILTTIMFNDKKMSWSVGILCAVLLAVVLLYRRFSLFSDGTDVYFWPESIIAYGILAVTGLICSILRKNQNEKDGIIQQGYRRQIEMREQLNLDQKTGLCGHTAFVNTLAHLAELSEITEQPLALAFLDLDNFKEINDTYGHLKGDEVILSLAGLLKKCCGDGQYPGRFGGEEFAIIFTNGSAAGAYAFSENLRSEFEKTEYGFMDGRATLSIGVASWKHGMTPEELLELADAAMYVSKRRGKNQISIFEEGHGKLKSFS